MHRAYPRGNSECRRTTRQICPVFAGALVVNRTERGGVPFQGLQGYNFGDDVFVGHDVGVTELACRNRGQAVSSPGKQPVSKIDASGLDERRFVAGFFGDVSAGVDCDVVGAETGQEFLEFDIYVGRMADVFRSLAQLGDELPDRERRGLMFDGTKVGQGELNGREFGFEVERFPVAWAIEGILHGIAKGDLIETSDRRRLRLCRTLRQLMLREHLQEFSNLVLTYGRAAPRRD